MRCLGIFLLAIAMASFFGVVLYCGMLIVLNIPYGPPTWLIWVLLEALLAAMFGLAILNNE